MARHSFLRRFLFFSFVGITTTVWFLPFSVSAASQVSEGEDMAAIGQQIYRQGQLASGEPVEAYVMGDMKVLGTQFTCLNCHGRSGMGGAEGRTFTPAINPDALFSAREGVYLARDAYTDVSLAEVIRTGKTPGKQHLLQTMPSYHLSDAAMKALIKYLKTLSASFSPGVEDTTIHFATVINDQADPEKVQAMLTVLQRFFQDKNAKTRFEDKRQQRGPFYQHYRIKAYRDWVLHVWKVHGPPQGWPAQLADYAKQQPVFAMVSGLVAGSWQPIHQFCEEHSIPCLLPNTDVPKRDVKREEKSFYTLYFSEGLGLEARVIADEIIAERVPAHHVLQVVQQGSAGLFAAEIFEKVAGKQEAVTLRKWVLKSTEQLSWKTLAEKMQKLQADTVILWLSGRELADAVPGEVMEIPGTIYLSSTLLGGYYAAMPEIRGRQVKLVHPFNPPENQEPALNRLQVWLDSRNIPLHHPRIMGQTFYASMILGKGLAHIKNHFYRDYLLDALDHGNGKSIFSINYPRLSYGPEQRYLAKGAYIFDYPLHVGKAGRSTTHWRVPGL